MADNERSRAAAALLRRAANLLNPSNPSNQSSSSTARIVIEDTSESDTNTIDAAASTSSATLTNPPRPSIQPTASLSLSGQSSTSGSRNPVLNEEFQRLFAPYNRQNNTRVILQPTAKRSRSNSYGQTGQSRYFKPQDTWTHDFICLANHEQRCVPTRMEKIKLQNAGLGR